MNASFLQIRRLQIKWEYDKTTIIWSGTWRLVCLFFALWVWRHVEVPETENNITGGTWLL